jgi:hypothetical protein
MSEQAAVDNPTHMRRRFRSIRILGISALLLVVLLVAAPWIVAHSGVRDTAINTILASPGVAASSDSASFGWLLPLCISALLLAVLLVAAPWIVAHSGVRDTAINTILASPSVTASSDSASFGWFSPLSVDGLHLKSANNHVDIRMEVITAEKSLWQLLSSSPDLGAIDVEKVHVLLELPLDVQIERSSHRLEPTFTATVKNAALTVRFAGQSETVIEVDDINMTFRVEKEGECRVLTLDPIVLFNKRKMAGKLANRLLHLLDPTISDTPQINGAFSLSLDKVRIPLGVPKDEAVKHVEMEGKLVLHDVLVGVRNPMAQALVRLVADMNGKHASEVVRLAHNAEIRFQVRDGRLCHEGLRIGFPEIDPKLELTSRGSVGLDKTLDLFVELPRLDEVLRKEKGPARCRITGTIANPKVTVEDGSLVLRQHGHIEPIIAADGINLIMQVENTASGCVLAVEPVEVFTKRKLSLGVAAGLVKLLAPDVQSDRQVAGEISLSFNKLRIPLGVARHHEFKQVDAEGKLTLHQVASEVKSPLWRGLIRLLADMHGKEPSNVIRLVEDSEIHFQVRDGRLYHDGQRIGFPEIDPDLVISSRGSIGIDETLDLHLEIPRLRKHKRDKGPLRCHVTGTLREPTIAIQDAPLFIRSQTARRIMRGYAWAFRTGLVSCSLRCAARWASLGRATSLWQFLQSSWSKVSRLGFQHAAGRPTILRAAPGPAIPGGCDRTTRIAASIATQEVTPE